MLLLSRAALTSLKSVPRDTHDVALPEDTHVRRDVGIDVDHLGRYCRLTGYHLRSVLPITYPRALAFPMTMGLLTSRGFPFPAIGLLHISEEITQLRDIGVNDRLTFVMCVSNLAQHRRGTSFDLLCTARVDDEPVWRERSRYLCRRGGGASTTRSVTDSTLMDNHRAIWRIGADIGRKYAAISGDYNPIHLNSLSAKLFGQPRQIAHGMWSLAACLAALEQELPQLPRRVSARFRRPLRLPARDIRLHARPLASATEFALRSRDDESCFISGQVASQDCSTR